MTFDSILNAAFVGANRVFGIIFISEKQGIHRLTDVQTALVTYHTFYSGVFTDYVLTIA